jgi:hypothetical protein
MNVRPTEHSYFVVMIQYPRRVSPLTGLITPAGVEAIVDPEITRRGVIEGVRTGEYDRERIAFIHWIRDCTVEDVTAEILEAVGVMEVA